MYICNDCGALFEEPVTCNEKHPCGEGYAYELIAVCPSCAGSFGKAVKCTNCGCFHGEEKLNDGMCTDCMDEMLQTIVDAIYNVFTKEDFDKHPYNTFDNIWSRVGDIFNI